MIVGSRLSAPMLVHVARAANTACSAGHCLWAGTACAAGHCLWAGTACATDTACRLAQPVRLTLVWPARGEHGCGRQDTMKAARNILPHSS